MNKKVVYISIIIIAILLLIGAYYLFKNKSTIQDTPSFTCPNTTHINCMPSPDASISKAKYCSWVSQNCPNINIAW